MAKPLTELQRRILDKYEPDSHDVSMAIVAVLDRLDFLESGWRKTMAEMSAETTDATRLLDEAATLAADRLKVIDRLYEDMTIVVADRKFAIAELKRIKADWCDPPTT